MNMNIKSLSTRQFYGKDVTKLQQLEKQASQVKYVERYVMKDILNGPSLIWKTFRKQEQALEYQKLCKGGLMTFAFETSFGPSRQFLVAHPEVFWHYNAQRDIEDRSTYEIIRENSVCKIYFDLEFKKELNRDSNGDEMVDLWIKIVLIYIKKYFNFETNRDQILDLDSSNDTKFSRHLIFNMPNHAFIDNKHVGNFVKKICNDLKQPGQFQNLNVQSLFITDGKNTKLFCDEGVYTKNRHFRCYKNTKKSKNSPLVLSEHNKFMCNNELDYFLCSLITHVKSDSKILEFTSDVENIKHKKIISTIKEIHTESPYPSIDQFINDYIKPGKIYRSVYFASSNTLVYDIINNRFCGKINREHKSNNVKYIVNIDTCSFYQKCHDWECRDYRSDEKPLPEDLRREIRPEIPSESEKLGMFGVFDEISPEMLGEIENQVAKKAKLERFPSFGLSDDAFLDIDL